MLLRLRVRLPDRPGTLGQVARTLGVAGADIVQVVVLERVGGRAVDDFTVMWPLSAGVDRGLAGLTAVPGGRVAGAWRATELPGPGGREGAGGGPAAGDADSGLFAPPFHRGEVERLAQLAEAVAAVLGDRLDGAVGSATESGAVNGRAA